MKICSKTGEHSSVAYDGEEYFPEDGVFTLPERGARELISAHGFQEFVPLLKKAAVVEAEAEAEDDTEDLAEGADGKPDFARMKRKELQAYLRGEGVAFDRSAGVDDLRVLATAHHGTE